MSQIKVDWWRQYNSSAMPLPANTHKTFHWVRVVQVLFRGWQPSQRGSLRSPCSRCFTVPSITSFYHPGQAWHSFPGHVYNLFWVSESSNPFLTPRSTSLSSPLYIPVTPHMITKWNSPLPLPPPSFTPPFIYLPFLRLVDSISFFSSLLLTN